MGTGKIGAKIVLEGEAAYRKALRDINAEQKELRSEMKLCNTQYKDSQNSMDALTKKYSILTKSLDTSAQKVALYEKALQTSNQKSVEASKRIEELRSKLDNAQKEFDEMSKSSEATADAMKEQQEAIDKLGQELRNAEADYDKAITSSKKYQTQLNNANAEMVEFEKELEDTKKYMREAENSSDGLAHSLDEYGKETQEASDNTKVFGDVLRANLTSAAVVEGIKALVKGVKDVASACIDTGMQFEASMSNVQALSGATSDELERMTLKAKELGASTIYSASEVADAMSYMALAGWNTEQTLQGVDSVLNLAAAASMDLAKASDIVTDYLTAFGLEAKDAEKFTDQLAFAMSHSNTTVELLGESYKNCASAASSMGFSVEDVTSALMVMANAGVKGGEAGTSLRSIMINLATNTNGCADALEDFGASVYDLNTGEMNSLSDILISTASAFEGLSDQEANALAKTIAGKTQFAGFETILLGLNDAAKESGMSFEDYADALTHCDGAAADMAKTMQDNLKGKVTALGSAMEGLKISVYETFDDTLKEAVDAATNSVAKLNKSVTSGSLNVSLSKMAKSLSDFAGKAIEAGERSLPKLIDGLAWLMDNSAIIASGLAGIATAQFAMKTVVPIIQGLLASWQAYKLATEGATVAQWALNVAMEANPIGLIVTALAGLTAATVAYTVSITNEKTEAEKNFDVLIGGYSEVVESAKELADATKTFSTETKNEFNYVSGLVGELQTLTAKESLSADEKKRVAVIAKELNARYQDLNLTIDEQTGKLADSNGGWEELINTQLRQAQVSAVQDRLTQIYKDQADYQFKIWEIGEKINDNEERRAEIDRRLIEIQKLGDDANMEQLQEMQLLYEEADRLADENLKLADTQQELTNSNDELSESVGELTTYMEDSLGVTLDATGNMQEYVETVEEARKTVVTLSEDASKAITGMYDSVSKSISGQMDLFSEWNSKTEIDYKDLIKNLDDQTTALEKWSENLEVLVSKGIDEGLYKKLAEMGPEGAAYVQAFVDMATDPNNNTAWKEYQENFKKAVSIQDSTAQEITKQYAELAEYIIKGMELGLSDDGDVVAAIGEVSDDLFQKFCDDNGIHSPSELYREWAEFIPEGMKLGIEDGEDSILDTIDTVSADMINRANEALSNGDFENIGYNISAGLAAGIASGASEVIDAIEDVCTSAIKTAQSTLDIHSPSKKFEWMGEMSGEGYILGLQNSMDGVSNTINAAMGSMESVGSIASGSNNPISQLISLVEEYLPEIAEKSTSVNVSLEGDAQGLFNAVRRQNRIYSKSTGHSAFA